MQLLPDTEQSRVLIKALKEFVTNDFVEDITQREIEIAEELELEIRKKLRQSKQ